MAKNEITVDPTLLPLFFFKQKSLSRQYKTLSEVSKNFTEEIQRKSKITKNDKKKSHFSHPFYSNITGRNSDKPDSSFFVYLFVLEVC